MSTRAADVLWQCAADAAVGAFESYRAARHAAPHHNQVGSNTMSKQATRLRRVGPSRATVRATLNARDAAAEGRRFGANVVRFAR